ncbi:baseplate J/gp47 family protein [Pseudomonas sp. NPDC090201]|uniref:baseplate J/gp47 family protein n=1 Tax=Pseudomonas sp. NPDC090201 TaxID=3364475 RepID=UPI00380D7E49
MALSVPSYDSILSNILRDIRNVDPEADITSDSDNYVRSASFASALEGYYQKLAWVYDQIFADTADDDEVIHEASLRGLFLKSAVASGSSVALTGTAGVGATLLQGATMTHVASGAVFVVAANATLNSLGVGTATVLAQTAGVAANGLIGALTLSSPPLGMDTGATFVSATVGGEDEETVESLRARLLELIQEPPAGGADYDYKRWAEEVDGVASALVLPGRRGGGTVDVVITGSTGVPTADTIAACLAHILSVCSVIADVAVFAPTPRVVNSQASVELASGYLLADVQIAAQKAYDTLLGALKPTDSLKKSQIEAMVNNLAGVTDRLVLTPASNIAASDDPVLVGWIRPGTITLGLM